MAIYRIELSRSVGLQLLGGALLLGSLVFTGGTVLGYSLAARVAEAPGGAVPAGEPSGPQDPAVATQEPAQPARGGPTSEPTAVASSPGPVPGWVSGRVSGMVSGPAAGPPPPSERTRPASTTRADVAWAPLDPTAPREGPDALAPEAWRSQDAEAAPRPERPAPSAEGRSARFAVQVGAFRVRGNADALASSLRSRGYDPLVVRARSRSGQWLEHVHLSVHPGETVAAAAARSFSARERLPAIVVALSEPGTER